MEMREDAIRRGLELLRSPEHAWEDRSRVSRLSPVILTHPSNFNYFPYYFAIDFHRYGRNWRRILQMTNDQK